MKHSLLIPILIPSFIFGQLLFRDALSIDHTVGRGKTVTGQIQFANSGSDTIYVEIYQTDYSFNANGSNDFGEPGKMKRSNANWIKLGSSLIMVLGNQEAELTYEINVPDDSTLSGTYWSLIMFEEVNNDILKKDDSPIRIRTKSRYAVQLTTTLESMDDCSVNITFTNPALTKKSSQKIFSVDIKNTGCLLAVPQVWLEMFSLEGESVDIINAEQTRLYPDTDFRYKFDLNKFELKTYKGILVVDCGNDDLFGANYTLDLTE